LRTKGQLNYHSDRSRSQQHQNNLYKVIGSILLILPHLLGAPEPEIHGFVNSNPQAVAELTRLWHDFILQTTIVNALLWVIIGASAGYFTKKYIHPIANSGNQHV